MGYAHPMKSRRHIARLIAASVLVVGSGVVLAPGGASSVQAVTCTLCGGGEFLPLTPARIFDSRTASPINDVAPVGAKPLGAPEPATFNIGLVGPSGFGGLPVDPLQVLAVVVNITVTDPGAAGYLEAYGTGAQPAAHTSIINFAANQTVPNVAIVRPGTDGMLTIGLYGQSGSANVIVDVFGWFSTSAYTTGDGARLIPTTPSRILDTRDGTGLPGGVPAAVGPKGVIDLKIRGANGVNPPVTPAVPDSPTISGVLLNVVGLTTEPGAKATYLSLLPDAPVPGVDPTTSNVNLAAGVIKANLVFVPVGTDGHVHIFNYQGATQVVADVVGYMQSGALETTRSGRVVPLTSPYRTFDTRQPQFGGVALGPGQAEDWSYADFASSVFIGSAAVGPQLGVIGNLTSAEIKRQYPSQIAQSYLTAYPADAARPTSSNLNTIEGPPVPNMAVLKYGANAAVRVYNNAGYTQYIFDASAVILSD